MSAAKTSASSLPTGSPLSARSAVGSTGCGRRAAVVGRRCGGAAAVPGEFLTRTRDVYLGNAHIVKVVEGVVGAHGHILLNDADQRAAEGAGRRIKVHCSRALLELVERDRTTWPALLINRAIRHCEIQIRAMASVQATGLDDERLRAQADHRWDASLGAFAAGNLAKVGAVTRESRSCKTAQDEEFFAQHVRFATDRELKKMTQAWIRKMTNVLRETGRVHVLYT